MNSFKSLFNVFLEIALECNRPIALQPFGQVRCGAVCCVAALANSTGYWQRTTTVASSGYGNGQAFFGARSLCASERRLPLSA